MTRPRRLRNDLVQSPLETYLREINETALLTADEEKELAYRIGSGDTEARDQMVRANLRLVVNIARGWLIDEQALLHALQDKTILAAGLDVFEAEPKVPAEFLEMDNVICLPHMTGASTNAWINMSNMVIGNLVSWFEGKGALDPVPECREMAKARQPVQ